jgi:hypothetical protein
MPNAKARWIEAEAGLSPEKKRFWCEPAYSGGILTLPADQFPLPTVIDLAGLDTSDPARPALMRHQKTDAGIVGHTSAVTNDGRELLVEGYVLTNTEAGASVAQKARDGFPWEVSVGVDVDSSEIIDEGQSVTVNGQTFQGPVEVIRRGRFREVSFCVIGADRANHVQVEASAGAVRRPAIQRGQCRTRRVVHASIEGSPTMGFEEWVKSLGLDVSTLSEAQTSELRRAYDAVAAQQAAEATDGAPDDERPAAEAAAGGRVVEAASDIVARLRRSTSDEIRRQESIREVCRGHRAIEAAAIDEGLTVDQARIRVLEASAPTWARTQGAAAAGSWEQRAAVIEAAICRDAGVRDATLQRHFSQQVLEASNDNSLRGITLGQVFGEFANHHGGHVRPGRLSREDLRHVAQVNSRVVEAAGGFSTVSLPGILGNAANKILLDAYQSVESPVDRITSPLSTPDFKEFKAYRLTGKGELQPIGGDGELKSISLQEEEQANQVDQKGGILTLTEKMMTNDDLGSFNQIAAILGRMAADKLLLEVVRAKLANSGSFYHSDNGNLLTGGTSVLGISGLNLAVKAFWELKDKNGVPILMNPAQLLVPASLKGLADQIRISNVLNETTTTDKAKPASNPYAGQFDVIPIPYLGSTFDSRTLQTGSDTKWWLEAKPVAGAAPINVAYLNGQRQPRIEQGDAPFNVVGTQFRVLFYFGVALGDKRTTVQCNGA